MTYIRGFTVCVIWPQRRRAATSAGLQGIKMFQRLLKMYSHFVDFVQQKTRFTVWQPYMLPVLYWQYRACWCPGDLRSQGTNSHGVDQISLNVLSLASEVYMNNICWHAKSRHCIVNYHITCSTLNHVCCVATVCHQICCMCWGHLGDIHRALSHWNWYKIPCRRDVAFTFSQLKSLNMFSM